MNCFDVGEVVKGLLDISAELDVVKSDFDETDGSVSVAINDSGKIKRFLIEFREV